MDDAKEGVLLIATTMVVLIAFALTVLAVMVIYHKRKIEHGLEIKKINERFSKELLQTQLEVQRQTMQYIGREIHDNVGQQLTLAFLYTQQYESGDQKTQSQLQSVASIINEALSALRNLSKSLTDPDHLEDGLDQLIGLECYKVQSTGLCKVVFHSRLTAVNTSDAVKTFVLRILQEFLHNSIKHSGCTTIDVTLFSDDRGVQLHAADNGRGFRISNNHSGIGLINMKKRAAMIDAHLVLESTIGNGTKMSLSIPQSSLQSIYATQHRYRG